jgi:hypothetical protein
MAHSSRYQTQSTALGQSSITSVPISAPVVLLSTISSGSIIHLLGLGKFFSWMEDVYRLQPGLAGWTNTLGGIEFYVCDLPEILSIQENFDKRDKKKHR